MLMKNLLGIIILSHLMVLGHGKYNDCERPPNVDYAFIRMHTDDNEEFVLAVYTCEPGFTLKGSSQIRCDLDSDEWIDEPPLCEQVLEVTTVGYENTDDDKSRTADNNEEQNIIEKKRKNKKEGGHGIIEDGTITNEFAKHLDMSCHQKRIKAPSISNGAVVKYERRKSAGHVFLVALYVCTENFELEDLQNNARYCSNGRWIAFSGEPTCISVNEDYDGDDDDEEEEEEEENHVVVTENVDKNHQSGIENETVTDNNDENLNSIKNNEIEHHNAEDNVEIMTNSENDTDIDEVKIYSETCGSDRGGCDHNCRVVKYPNENQLKSECMCNKGYILDSIDLKRCHDIDECQENNGGCEQICVNTPGGFECSCGSGFQIDSEKKCIDVDECQYTEIQIKCPYGCENLIGSYLCKNQHRNQDSNYVDEKNESNQQLNEVIIKNEEEEDSRNRNNEIKRIYHTDDDVTIVDKNEIECPESYRKNEDGNCVDIDECAEGITGCQYCVNKPGGFECICPAGYELSDDEKTCRDIDECRKNPDDDNQTLYTVCSHECINLEGSFQCTCPDNFHLEYDRRTCTRDYCEHLSNPEFNKIKCSHECVDEAQGFVCKCPEGYTLDTDFKTCLMIDKCIRNETHRFCYPGKCINTKNEQYRCECPSGYSEQEGDCVDIDECSTNTHSCSHFCTNLEGSFECRCPDGYSLSEKNDKICLDIDECETHLHSCGSMVCINTPGSYKCVCPEGQELQDDGNCGYIDACVINNGECSHHCLSINGHIQCDCPSGWSLLPDEKTCVQKNPCLNDNGGCSQICDPGIPGLCACNGGYKLLSDGRTCEDNDECQVDNGGCSHTCVNEPGSYRCMCNVGFQLLNGSCIDIDECLSDETHNCENSQSCINTFGSFHCICPEGFIFDTTIGKCSDFNECSINNGNCSHDCENLLGTYKCSCPQGQILSTDEKTCNFINMCELNNGECSHECKYINNIVICYCPNGYILDSSQKNCIDIDECSQNNGGCSHTCKNYIGHFNCLCPTGYKLNADMLTCEDVDECSENNGNCSDICVNLLGSRSCLCNPGYELQEDLRTCADVNECILSSHECSHFCINTDGDYYCNCPKGFKLKYNKTCEDINECEINLNGDCSDRCINTMGSYYCECPSGKVLADDNKTCIEVEKNNNQSLYTDIFHRHVDSQHNCPPGYKLNSDQTNCTDINECEESNNNGGCSHHCENLDGSFMCRCPYGFELNEDQKTCQDVDECTRNNGGCSDYCINYHGSFKCECRQGYTLEPNGKNCIEYDFCAVENGGCNQKCTSTSKGSECSCFIGFELITNKTCHDINECRDKNICPQECLNTVGSYECTCYPGFTKVGQQRCEDINECEYQNGGCLYPATCVNVPGSYKCICPTGYKLSSDRKTCLELRDYCSPLKPPKNGEVHCIKSRHKSQLFYKSKCTVWCHKGYKLQGPSVRHCNSSNGQWQGLENYCIPQSCPSLTKPIYGTILPHKCLTGDIFPGERCLLHCQPGYVPSRKKAATCNADQTWSTNSSFLCVPAIKGKAGIIKPSIKCPRDTILILPKDQTTVKIRLEQPKTNVDFNRYVDSYPAWGKHLQSELGLGEHIIRFRARSPNSNLIEMCRTIIKIKESTPPQVLYCPASFDAQLNIGEVTKSFVWREPIFNSANHIKQIFKSNVPGDKFGLGIHKITYTATDRNGETSRCEFLINVKKDLSKLSSYFTDPVSSYSFNRLDDHEAYLMCLGKPAIKIDINYPLHVPDGCFIKRIQLNPFIHRRRHRKHFNDQLKYYALWNEPSFERRINSLYNRRWV